MKRKNTFWFSLALGICFACAPVLAHAAQEKGAPAQAAQTAPPHVSSDQRDAQRTVSGPYRLTYTLTEMDGTKRLGSQRYAIVLDADARPTHIDMGARITFKQGGEQFNTQFMFQHIGLRVDASLRQFANGVELSTKLVQSDLAADQGSSITPNPDVSQNPKMVPPVVRNSQLETTALMAENKPVVLGQLDRPGSMHSLQVTVELTRVR